MRLGKKERHIQIEPVKNPVPIKQPAKQPEPVQTPEKVPVKQ